MSEPLIWLNIFGHPVQAYSILLALAAIVCMVPMHMRAVKNSLKKTTALTYMLCAAPLALFLARLIYCAVRYEWIFLDEMGEFGGLWHFFEIGNGGLNIVGAILGCLLAGAVCAFITHQKAGVILDHAAPWGALLIAIARFVQPLSGQGYGDLVESPALSFYPMALQNEWGEWSLAVCTIEGMLALVLFFVLLHLSRKTMRSGTLSLYFLTLFCASQIMPQSLRSDDVLFIFIFARVTQIGYMVLLISAAAVAGERAVKRMGVTNKLIGEWLLLLLGVFISIGAEFALDKTNLPDVLVYVVMVAALIGMAAVICLRIKKEDVL
jgi:prolipoprotein diacylglyceryltransferase